MVLMYIMCMAIASGIVINNAKYNRRNWGGADYFCIIIAPIFILIVLGAYIDAILKNIQKNKYGI